VSRAAAAFALAASALAACSGSPGQQCPGEPVAHFTFTGARIYLGDAALAGLDPVPAIPDCSTAVGPPPYPDTLPGFDATLAADASTQAAALCRPRGIVLFGQRSGTRYSVEGSTDGAVLASCSPTCSAELRLIVAGDVAVAPDGTPTGFQGILIEVMSLVAGDCGTCLPPPANACAARYTLTGTP
jgi:hypothetical protein